VWNGAPVALPRPFAAASEIIPAPSDARSMNITGSGQQIPYYLVLRAGHECYVLDLHRDVIRRGASQLLKAFARGHSVARPLDDADWNPFSEVHQFSAEERAMRCMFSLVAGRETPRQLELLATL
jgi:hypothetical protein